MKKKNLIPARVYETIQPTGSQCPCMYDFPKTHKDVALCPILSIIGSAQYQLAKWLTSLLDPVLQLFFMNCIPHSFTFVETLRKFQFFTSSLFLCSFDICSLFTNVFLQETIEICTNALYDDDLIPLRFPGKFLLS